MRLIQSGPRDAKIVLVGEAPGDTEMASGVPFSGASGELLNKMLSRVGILREDCFCTNICHIQPKGKKKNDFDWFLTPEGQPWIMAGIMQLHKDISEIKPNVVVALGSQPLRVLTKKIGIDKWRGSILDSTLVPGTKVISTYHPAFVLRSWDYKAVCEMDLRRVCSDSAFPDLDLPKREFLLNLDRDARRPIIAELLASEWLSIDIECYERSDGSWQLACVGFSDVPSRALVIPYVDRFAHDDIKLLCESDGPDKIFQNGQFDVSQLAALAGIKVRGYGEVIRDQWGSIQRVRGWDTMYAQHALYPECAMSDDETTVLKKGRQQKVSAIKKGLAFLVSINTREPFYKDDGKLWKEEGDLQLFWRYNALDAACTREIKDAQESDLRTFGTLDTFRHEMSLVRTLMGCTARGLAIDHKMRRDMKSDLERELMNLQVFLDAGAGKHVNVFSNGVNGDVGKFVYGDLGLPVKYNKDSGNPTLDKNALAALSERYPNPLLRSILAIRERRKIIETYLETKLGPDGRMRCLFDPSGTRTGRLSSRSSLDDSGQNLQNQPLRVREYFVADPGRVLIQRDYGQAEARVVAKISRSKYLNEVFDDPTRDIHRENASRIFGIPPHEVTYSQRLISKKGVHAGNYGQGPESAAAYTNAEAHDTWGRPGTGILVSVADMRRVQEGYFMLAPEIKSVYWNGIRAELNRSRTLSTLFGRKRTFYGRWESSDDSKFLNAAYSFIPQGTVGELCTRAMVDIDYAFEAQGIDAHVLLNGHDALLVETRDDPEYVEMVSSVMEAQMRIPIYFEGEAFYIPTDCEVGYNWGKRSEKNPRGLQSLTKYLDSHAAMQISRGG